MRASVIITTWNRVNSLRRIIDNLYQQGYEKKEYEIIVCDSNSPDGTSGMVAEKVKELYDLNLSLIQTYNSISHKRNAGIRAARGDVLIFIDDDCIPSDDFISSHVGFIESIPRNCVVSGLIHYRDVERYKSKSYIRYKISRHNRTNSMRGLAITKPRSLVAMNLCVYKSDLLKNNIFFNDRICAYGLEDYDFAKRCIRHGVGLYVGNAAIFHEELDASFLGFSGKIAELSKSAIPVLLKTNDYSIDDLPFIRLEASFIEYVSRLFSSRFLHSLKTYLAVFFDFVPFVPNTFVRALIVISYMAGKRDRQ